MCVCVHVCLLKLMKCSDCVIQKGRTESLFAVHSRKRLVRELHVSEECLSVCGHAECVCVCVCVCVSVCVCVCTYTCTYMCV